MPKARCRWSSRSTVSTAAKKISTESFGAILPFGIGYLAVDGPGTGQAPIKVSETSERMLSKVIDYAQSRPEIDKNRIALHGVSWGAYWATKMAIVERARLRGCSAQSPPVDMIFPERFPDELTCWAIANIFSIRCPRS